VVEGDQIRPRGCQAYWVSGASDGECAAARSPGRGPILSRICLESVSTRDKSTNSASYSPLRGHTHGITNVEGEAGAIPAAPASKWLTFNSFRSASTSGSAADAVPVIVDDCNNECSDNLQLTFQVGNATSPGVIVDIDPADFPGGKVRVVVDDDNGVDLFDECHEDIRSSSTRRPASANAPELQSNVEGHEALDRRGTVIA